MAKTIKIKKLDDLLSKNFATLVSFEWGENFSESSHYISWTNDVTINEITYLSIPELEIKIDKQHGGAKDANAKIIIPNSYSPINKLTRPFPHSDCRVTILECDPEDASNTLYILYFGYITRISLGKFETNSMAEIAISGLKSQSEFSIGFSANSDCILNLFDKYCKVIKEEYSATIQSISEDGMTLLVSSPVLITTTTEIPTTTTEIPTTTSV